MRELNGCPKCDGTMIKGVDLGTRYILRDLPVSFRKEGDWRGDRVIPYYCKKCGFVELYKEMKEKKK